MSEQRNNLDKNVSPNWKPVEGLTQRKPGMLWSDRVWHVLVSLAGLVVMGCGILVFAYLHLGKAGGLIIGLGFIIFVLGFPSRAQEHGYRE